MEDTPEIIESLLQRIARLEARVLELERNQIRWTGSTVATWVTPKNPHTIPNYAQIQEALTRLNRYNERISSNETQ